MKVLNFGSLNIDCVYKVAHFVRPGETLSADSFARFPGGKGLNQSVALARAGARVIHAGQIGGDGIFLLDLLKSEAVDCRFVRVAERQPTGHAMIQVNPDGENAIVLDGGANRTIAAEDIRPALDAMEPGDILLLQNEISAIPEIMTQAARRGLRIFFNAAPADAALAGYPLELTDTFIVNETEAATLEKLIPELFPRRNRLLTLGKRGARYLPGDGGPELEVPAAPARHVVDTTGAGDTFTGYFVAKLAEGGTPSAALELAAQAAARCVERPGAAASIPRLGELTRG